MHFCLVKMMMPGCLPSNAFDDVILPLYYALGRLGYTVETRVNSINPASVNILFGTCQMPGLADHVFPANSIVFNLEQMATKSSWNNKAYVDHLRRFAVWDYSHRNARYLRKSLSLADVTEIRLGSVPEMTRLNQNFPQDIDVLFYGTVNERRERALNALYSAGIRLTVLQNTYGIERDHAIARSKLILNIHYYIPATLEVPRLGYLWANSKAVVSEFGPQTERDSGLEECCRFCEFEEIVPTVKAMLAAHNFRRAQAEKAFTAFSRLRQEDFLEPVVGRRAHAGGFSARPGRLHVGSGKDFRPASLNVDSNPLMNPDLVLDIAKKLDPARRYATSRFGEITLTPGSFTHITAFEVLEHVRNLPRTMRNLIDLLCAGGELQISVPYELSLGAWQDPTHLRAFNENSWLYYSKWAWYMGWRDVRFNVESLTYTPSDYGRKLSAQGKSIAELLKIPRAVDGMSLTLRKRETTAAEQEEYDLMSRAFYHNAVGAWTVR